MTQIHIVEVSSSAEPCHVFPQGKFTVKTDEIAQSVSQFAQVQEEYPACEHILSLLLHLHSDCANPELAAYKTLQWLANVIQYDEIAIYTCIAFSDGAGTGKTLFLKEIVEPVFGGCGAFSTTNPKVSHSIHKMNFFEIQSNNPHQEMLSAYSDITDEEIFDYPEKAVIFLTNQFIKPNPANRCFFIARCSTRLNDTLHAAVIAEIENGGLMQFADLLHTIDGSTKQLPDLNAIY